MLFHRLLFFSPSPFFVFSPLSPSLPLPLCLVYCLPFAVPSCWQSPVRAVSFPSFFVASHPWPPHPTPSRFPLPRSFFAVLHLKVFFPFLPSPPFLAPSSTAVFAPTRLSPAPVLLYLCGAGLRAKEPALRPSPSQPLSCPPRPVLTLNAGPRSGSCGLATPAPVPLSGQPEGATFFFFLVFRSRNSLTTKRQRLGHFALDLF